MKQNSAQRAGTICAEERYTPSKPKATTAADFQGFATQLRALGQALEKFKFSAFDLELKAACTLSPEEP